jgi:hypothetical protein
LEVAWELERSRSAVYRLIEDASLRPTRRADQEGEAIEHPLVGDPGLARDQLADPVGEVLIVGHDGIFRRRAQLIC